MQINFIQMDFLDMPIVSRERRVGEQLKAWLGDGK